MIIVQEELLPHRYHEASELTMEVAEGGTEDAKFDLKSK